MTYHDTNNLRLEIETTPPGLPNLVQNPSGDLGSWGWVTPVANTLMQEAAGNPNYLVFTTVNSQAAYVTTEFLPVAASRYVASRFTTGGITTGHNVKARFEFYNSSKTLLSSSTQTGALGELTTHYVPSVQAPANTSYVKLRLDFYNGTGNPSAMTSFFVREVMVTHAATSAGLGSSRTNLITNPSFETNTTGWTSAWWGSISRVTTQAYVGSASVSLTNNYSSSTQVNFYSDYIPVSGGGSYNFSFYSKAATTARDVFAFVEWFNSSQTSIGSGGGSSVANNTSGWTRASAQVTAPSDAAYGRVKAYVGVSTKLGDPAVGEQHYFDAFLLEQTNAWTPGSYFDGSSTASGKTYAWTGTAHASSSTETTAGTSYDYAEPVYWQNILGPSHEITIGRKELDVGLMNVSINDALLDPALSSTIRPGKKIRLQSLINSKWEDVFNGKVTDAHVSYDKDKDIGGKVHTTISLAAVDAIAHLANQGESRGIASITDLPYVLEGKGVPWDVNGSGNQVTSATVVSYNENASVLDQIAVTRDTARGYAWVDNRGVLKARDSGQMPSTTQAVFADGPTAVTSGSDDSFEAGINGFYDGWNSASDGSQWYTSLTRSTEQKHSGTYSMKGVVGTSMYSTKIYSDGYLAYPGTWSGSTPWPVEGGKFYEVSMWVRTNMAVFDSTFEFNFIDANGKYKSWGGDYDVSIPADTWTKITARGQAHPSAVWAGLELYLYPGSVTGLVFYIDDITFTEATGLSSYTDINVDFDLDRCINQVMVNWLRYDIGAGTTTEIPYGPYEDANSIATWGARSATFTIHGATESAADIQTYATNVLNANKTPSVKANSLVMPVRNADEMAKAATIDLYDRVEVWFGDKVKGMWYRITGISHTITPEKWSVTYDFSGTSSVAMPTWTPSPPFAGVTTPTSLPAPTATSTNGTASSGTTEIRDDVLGTYSFTAEAGARYRVFYDGVALNSTVANDRYGIRIRNGGSSTPTTASTIVAESTVVIPVTGSNGRTSVPIGATFVPGAGTVTLAAFTIRLAGTGTGMPVSQPSRELYVMRVS